MGSGPDIRSRFRGSPLIRPVRPSGDFYCAFRDPGALSCFVCSSCLCFVTCCCLFFSLSFLPPLSPMTAPLNDHSLKCEIVRRGSTLPQLHRRGVFGRH